MATEQWYLVREADRPGWGSGAWGETSWGGSPIDVADPDLEAVPLVRDAINPFANKARVRLDDPDGVKPEQYPQSTLVELYVEIPGLLEPTRRFAGFVADDETDRNETELLILSHDFWLRKQTVYYQADDEQLSSILETLIETFTPLIWDADLVTIENDDVISRRWAGETLERVLEEIATISGGGELPGATFDREFTFGPLETESSPRDFDVGEFVETEWEDDGKRAANRAVVRYGRGEDEAVVTRNNRSAQRALADEIGADRPVQITVEERRPEIEREARAKDYGDQLLAQRSELETGTIQTWEGFDIDPGQLVAVEDPSQRIDDEFRIVQLDYAWPDESTSTTVTVANKALDTTDELVALSDDVQRIDLRDADPDAPLLETLEERVGVLLDVVADVTTRLFGDDRFRPGFGRDALGFGRASPGYHILEVRQAGTETSRATNTTLSAIRDGWIGDGLPDLRELRVGDGDSTPRRTDTALEADLAGTPATVSTAATDSLRWTGTLRFDADGDTTLREVGLVDSEGDLHTRATLDSDLDAPPLATVDVSVRYEIADDPDELGTLEAAGAATIRDILANDDPALPTQMRFTVVDGADHTLAIDELRSRGTGRLTATTRLAEDIAGGDEIEAIAQLDTAGTALMTNDFSPIEIIGFDLEATQRVRIQND